MKLLKKASVIFDRAVSCLAVLAGILLVFMTLSVSAEITSRYFLGHSLDWVIELNEYSLLYIAFLVAAWVLKKGGHVSMDLVLNRLNPRTQSLITSITSLIGAIVCFILTWYGAKVTWHLFRTDYFTPTILELPKYIITSIIFVGSFFLFVQFIRRTYEYLMLWRASSEKV